MTQDNAMDVSPSWQDLDAWREAVLETWEQMPDRSSPGDLMALGNVVRSSPDYTARRHKSRVRALEADRDALAAHLARLTQPAVELATTVENEEELPLHKWALKCARLVPEILKAAKEAPATSLARLKAEWQAQALEDVANYLQYGEGKDSVNPPVSIRGRAIRLRCHAEEGES